MENFYTAYTKTVDGVNFYFVKHYQTFPEYKDVLPLLENYGMHTDFYKACRIAMIDDKAVREQLSQTVNLSTAKAKIIRLKHSTSHNYSFKNWVNLTGLLRLVNLR